MNYKTILKLQAFLIPLFSALSFGLQPMIGKSILPIQGGSISSWLTLMFFFQVVLLSGYIFAYILNKFSIKIQATALIILSILSVITLSLDYSELTLTNSPTLLFIMGQKMLLPSIFLFSFSILIQGWFSTTSNKVPYYLYGLSNLGSFVGLLSYPFFIEIFFPLSIQTLTWTYIFYSLSWLTIILSVLLILKLPKTNSVKAKIKYIPILKSKYAFWLLLSFIPCLIYMELTRVFSSEWGSNPLTWLCPLGFYLLAFTITFNDKFWPKRGFSICSIFLAIGLLIYTYMHGAVHKPVSLLSNISLILIALGGILGSLKLLYISRPTSEQNFTLFYITIGVGGVLAGLAANFLYPILFPRPIELIIFSTVLLVILLFKLQCKDPLLNSNKFKSLIVIIPIFAIICINLIEETVFINEREYYRSNFSTYVVNTYHTEDSNIRTIVSGYTLHGVQNLDNPMQPVNYYWEDSAIGLWTRYFQSLNKDNTVAVVGLGSGVLSTYNRNGDMTTYFEIDPLVEKLANKYFTFLKDSKGINNVIIEDGRIGLKNYNDKFDYVVIDAFSGDGIPLYLLTKEAINDYMKNSLSGVVLMHISNRYWDLPPVINGSAIQNNFKVVYVETLNPESENIYTSTNCLYAIVFKPESETLVMNFLKSISELNKEHVKMFTRDEVVNWTDESYSIYTLPRE